MSVVVHNPPTIFPPYRCYAHALESSSPHRRLYISGLNGFELDGKTMPASFDERVELVWRHLKSALQSANMGVNDLVFLRTYLADPGDGEACVNARVKHLGSHRVALTVVCATLLDPLWKLEVEAIAEA